MPVIHLVTHIHAPVEICFDLARSIDLHKISTAHTGEQAIAGTTSGLIGLHETVTWRAKHLGIWQTLTSRITVCNSPQHLADEMVQGAFHSFTHDHYFHENNGITTMTDLFDYTSPLGILGKLADWLFLKQYMTRLLEQRNETIRHFAESGEWQQLLT